ncbi:hypothetical protein GPALN_010963 [Globodera pallida]|nr:hypothetical protein GPALN_010963 [Globodera pallida]
MAAKGRDGGRRKKSDERHWGASARGPAEQPLGDPRSGRARPPAGSRADFFLPRNDSLNYGTAKARRIGLCSEIAFEFKSNPKMFVVPITTKDELGRDGTGRDDGSTMPKWTKMALK